MFLVVLGLLWPRLELGAAASKAALVLAIYGCAAAWFANLMGAVWGAGNSILPLAAGPAHGTPAEEMFIVLTLRSSGVALIVAVALAFWGARRWSV